MRNAGELGFVLLLREALTSSPPAPSRGFSRRIAPLEEERDSEDLGFSGSRPPLLPCRAGSCPVLALAVNLPVLALLRGARAGESPPPCPLRFLWPLRWGLLG